MEISLTFQKGRLNGLAAYLAGPIENSKDCGIGWREKISSILINRYSMLVNNPCEKSENIKKYIDGNNYLLNRGELEEAIALKNLEKYSELVELVKKIMHADLRLVDKSDVIIAYYDSLIPSFGTVHEIVVGEQQRKPVYMVTKQGKKNAPAWAFGLLGHKNIFSSFDHLFSFLEIINIGNLNLIDNSKWLFGE